MHYEKMEVCLYVSVRKHNYNYRHGKFPVSSRKLAMSKFPFIVSDMFPSQETCMFCSDNHEFFVINSLWVAWPIGCK